MSDGIKELFIGENWSPATAEAIIHTLQRNGIYLTTENPDAPEVTEAEQPKEWIERQEEERRAWAIGTAVEHLSNPGHRHDGELIPLAEKIEAYVKGNQEDPDLHDQDALDNWGVVMTACVNETDIPTNVFEHEVWLNNLQNELTKAGVRFKNGKVLED